MIIEKIRVIYGMECGVRGFWIGVCGIDKERGVGGGFGLGGTVG